MEETKVVGHDVDFPSTSKESIEFWQEGCRIKICKQPPKESGKIGYTDGVFFPEGSIVEEGRNGVKVYRSMEKFLRMCDKGDIHLYFVDEPSVTFPPFSSDDERRVMEITVPGDVLRACPRCSTDKERCGSSLVRRPGGTWERLCQHCFETEMRGREPR